LQRWRQWIRESAPNEPELARDVRGLYAKYSITPPMLDEIIDGVEMDLRNVRYQTFEELRLYRYRVASAVGLVSIEIFGYRNPACRDYAIQLGLALQMTNIIRDVGKDLNNGRIYLPLEDLARSDYSESDLRARRYTDAFVRLMEFESQRAEEFFSRAAALLPREDRRSMVAAEIMASVYHALLRRMKTDRFRVFDKEYRLSKIEKSGRVAGQLLRLCLNARR
jgi:phytoene synthase